METSVPAEGEVPAPSIETKAILLDGSVEKRTNNNNADQADSSEIQNSSPSAAQELFIEPSTQDKQDVVEAEDKVLSDELEIKSVAAIEIPESETKFTEFEKLQGIISESISNDLSQSNEPSDSFDKMPSTKQESSALVESLSNIVPDHSSIVNKPLLDTTPNAEAALLDGKPELPDKLPLENSTLSYPVKLSEHNQSNFNNMEALYAMASGSEADLANMVKSYDGTLSDHELSSKRGNSLNIVSPFAQTSQIDSHSTDIRPTKDEHVDLTNQIAIDSLCQSNSVQLEPALHELSTTQTSPNKLLVSNSTKALPRSPIDKDLPTLNSGITLVESPAQQRQEGKELATSSSCVSEISSGPQHKSLKKLGSPLILTEERIANNQESTGSSSSNFYKAKAKTGRIKFQKVESSEIPSVMKQKYTLIVSKVDAGVALLLTNDHFLIEFPTMLLPENTKAGEIVNISIHRNVDAEKERMKRFIDLQNFILEEYTKLPSPIVIKVCNITQTTVLLELEPYSLHHANLKGVEVYKNLQRVSSGAAIVRENELRIKLSGLDISSEYEIHVVFNTSSGRIESNHLHLTTHGMDQLEGICVSYDGFDFVGSEEIDREKSVIIREMNHIIKSIGARATKDLSIDNTHLVCHPEGITTAQKMLLPDYKPDEKGKYEKAVELNIPIVSYDWLRACFQEKRVKQATEFYVRKYPDKIVHLPEVEK